MKKYMVATRVNWSTHELEGVRFVNRFGWAWVRIRRWWAGKSLWMS